MSITDADTIDIVSFDRTSGDLVLTVSDHLDWGQTQEHLEILEAKLNTYLEYLESAESEPLRERARGRAVVIRVVGRVPLNQEAREYFAAVAEQLSREGLVLRHEDAEEER